MLLRILILVSCFILAFPFGGSIDLATLDPTQGITLTGPSGSEFGTTIAHCDFNGDLVKDTLISAPAEGKVYVIFGGTDWSSVDLNNLAGSGAGFVMTFSGKTGFGTQLGCIGKYDTGDFEDIAVGFASPDNTYLYVIYGAAFSPPSDIDVSGLSSGYASMYSSYGEFFYGDIVGVGDTTGDGTDDFIVGLADSSGTVYYALVVYQTITVNLDVRDYAYNTMLFLIISHQSSPMSYAAAGKCDDDDYYDIVIGNLVNTIGEVVIIFGNTFDNLGYGTQLDLLANNLYFDVSSSYRGVFLIGSDTSGLGASVAYAGDINGDGRGDILIGAPNYPSNSNTGAAYIFLGTTTTLDDTYDIMSFPSSNAYKLAHGSATSLYGGSTVFGGLTSATPNVAVCDSSTTCYIVFGSSSLSTFDLDDMKSEGGFSIASSTYSGTNPMVISTVADQNSDGYPDYMIGQGAAGNGVVYIVYGPNKCTSPCKTCSGLTSSDWATCVTCETGFDFFYNDYCYSSCPSHSYQDSASTCASCHSTCLECSTLGSTACTSCDISGSLPLLYNSNQCVASCPSRYYKNSATTCAACNANCLECAGSSTTCTSCDTSGSLPLFYNSACYSQCPTGMAPDSSNACITTTPAVPQAVQTLSSTDETRQVSNEVMSTVSSLTLGGVHSIRSQSVAGPMSYFIFLNVDYPSNYQQFAKANYGSSRLPNPFRSTGRTTGGRAGSINSTLSNQSLLANIGYSIIFLAVCILLIPINDAALILLEKHTTNCQGKWYHQLLKRSSVSLRWSFLINQFVSKYQDLTFFSFLGIYNYGGDDDHDTLNLIICIFRFLITVAGLVGAFFLIKRLTKKLETFSEEEKEKEEYYKNDFLGRRVVLYKDLKKDTFMTMLYPFFLMVRVFGFSFVTIFLCNETAVQLVFLNLYAVLMFAYLLKYRPLEENGQLWMTLAYEIDAFLALLGVTLLAIYNTADGTNEKTRTAFGYMIIIANTGMLVLNFISFGLEMFEYAVLVYEKLKSVIQKLKNRKKVKPVEIKSKEEPLSSPTSSFAKLKECKTSSQLDGSPSVMPEGNGVLNDDSPGLPSPKNLSPFSSSIDGASTNERLSFLKVESSVDVRRNSTRKRLTHFRQSINLPVEEEIPESEV